MDFQTSLFAPPESRVPPTSPGSSARADPRRLGRRRSAAWLPDADDVFETLVRDVPWRAERRQMYDRVVDVPRLVHTYMIGEELPHPA